MNSNCYTNGQQILVHFFFVISIFFIDAVLSTLITYLYKHVSINFFFLSTAFHLSTLVASYSFRTWKNHAFFLSARFIFFAEEKNAMYDVVSRSLSEGMTTQFLC
jgi:hypothetical protein